jgi:hypothetical protein
MPTPLNSGSGLIGPDPTLTEVIARADEVIE